MTGRDVASILNFAAFRPEPDDPTSTWRKRFPNQRTPFLNIGRASLGWRDMGRGGRPGTDGDLARGEPKEALDQFGAQIKAAAENGWCAVSLNTRYVISLETNLSRRPGSEQIITSNPRSVLGARYERGKRYAVTHNPETNSSILVTCDEEHIRKMETMFREAGLRIGRICCGTYILLRHALNQTNITKSGDKAASFFYIVCCQGSVCALVQDQDRWMELRSRTDVYEDSIDPIIELIQPFKQRIAPDMELVLLGDQPQPTLVEKLGEVFSGHKLTDLSQPDLLWTLMFQS